MLHTKKFDLEDSAFLLAVLVEVLEQGRSRREAVEYVSKSLRNRAQLRGLDISDSFRNQTGIRNQLGIMEYEYTNGLHGYPGKTPIAFQEVVRLYRHDRNEFDALLRRALQSFTLPPDVTATSSSPSLSTPRLPFLPSQRLPELSMPSPFSLPQSFPHPVSPTLVALAEVLKSKGYAARAFATKEEATEYLAGAIRGTTVAFGGSVTLRETGLFDRLAERNAVVWHWRNAEGKSAAETLRDARNAAVYVSSANAIAATGEIVNIDGNGNRVAETTFGHERVYFVVGRNKLAPTLAEALQRAYSVAAPKNAARLNPDAPAPDVSRICRVVSVFNAAPLAAKYEVVLVDESLGY